MICNSYWNQVLNWAERLIWDDRVLIPVSSQLAPRQLERDLLKALSQLAGPVTVRVKSRRGDNPYARVYYLK